jgi:hypothetical protein
METPITLNVGGRIFQTYLRTITKYPTTMLATCFTSSLAKPNEKGEYFFDRDSTAFEAILNIYRCGKVVCPPTVDREIFNDELKYWGFDELPLPIEVRLRRICNLPKILGKVLSCWVQSPKPHLGTILQTVVSQLKESTSESDTPDLMTILTTVANQWPDEPTPDPEFASMVQIYRAIVTALDTDADQIQLYRAKYTDRDFSKVLKAGYFKFTSIDTATAKIECRSNWGCRDDFVYKFEGKIYYLDGDDGDFLNEVTIWTCTL